MATAKKAAARKTTANRSSSSSSSSDDKTEARPNADADMLNPLKNMSQRLQDLNLAGGAGKFFESGRKDLQALMQANEKSYQGLQAVVQRQTEMIKGAISEWQSATRQMPGKDVKENLAKLDELGRQSFQRSINDLKELADLAANSQKDAFEVVRQRIQENVEEATKLLQRK